MKTNDMANRITLTGETVTYQQISTLRKEALSAQDYDMGAICDLALGGAIDPDDYTTLSPSIARELQSMTEDEAHARCAAAINAATAHQGTTETAE